MPSASPCPLWRFLANPLTSALLLAALVFIAMNVGTGHNEHSRLASFVRHDLLQRPIVYPPPGGMPAQFFIKRNGSLRIIDPQLESWDELSRLMVEQPDNLAEIHLSSSTMRTGIWAPTRLHDEWQLTWIWMGESWPAEDQARAQDALAEYLVMARFWGERWSRVADGSGSITALLPRGYAINLLSAALLIGLALSLAWISRIPAWFRAAQRRLRHRPWMCPACGYDMRGLEGDTCPECGAPRPAP